MHVFIAVFSGEHQDLPDETLSLHRPLETAQAACLADARQRHNSPFDGEVLWRDLGYGGVGTSKVWVGYWSTVTEGTFEERIRLAASRALTYAYEVHERKVVA